MFRQALTDRSRRARNMRAMRGIVLTVGIVAFVVWDFFQNDSAFLREFLRNLNSLLF
jgi:hypothetical protein